MVFSKNFFKYLSLFIFCLYPFKLKGETWVVSSYPLYKIFSEIFSEKRLYLVQPPKGEFHFYEPLPKDWERIKKAEFVALLGTEPFAKKVYQLVPDERLFSLMNRGEELSDPHIWFDLKRLKTKLKNLMEKEFLKRDPNYPKWQERMQNFFKELSKLEREYATLKGCKVKEVYVLGHRVFYYLFRDVGIKEKSLVAGHHHGEITPKRLKEFLYEVKKSQIKGILLTEWEYLRFVPIFEKEGLKVYKVLTGDQNFEGNFLFLLEFNLKILRELLNC